MIVLVNGTFDILHVGHIKLFEFAHNFSDHLIVAIDSDERVRTLKGEGRPINNEYERSTLLKAIKYVSEVFTFDTDEDLINLVKAADIVVKGSDYRDKDFFERKYCKNIIFFDRIDEYSTTKKIQRITSR